MGEVGELAELLQWLPARHQDRAVRSEPLQTRLGEELSDVLLYLVRLADVCGIDLASAVDRKLLLNEQKHPAPGQDG
ncbi:MazG-like family protein [Aeromicrobium sp. 179-A 4D2 NHS]|uniref:MazG-like family protein n=1 Tax=Aeromicrobium sp. 179-A 4D2 NHS TaxID=3142375 RepID=UPI0039A104D4